MIILDTSFLFSLLNKRDTNHVIAEKLFDEIVNQNKFGKPVIFEYVLDEFLTIIGNKHPFAYVKRVVDFISLNIEQGIFLLITLDGRDALYDTIKLFKKLNEDKTCFLSFTDCAIIFSMLKNRISYLASFDSGFNKVLDKIEEGVYILTDSKKREIERVLVTPFGY
ncbi:MAG: PIN domain-containing protein [Saccharolobus sp.]|uniref:type II toxin-antitoxin system VapC family toxin n=1 Tax=Saccharolobus TaxID=2100760 RepID=UPI001F0EF86C|nr:PIN domain-containing protein [Saccharolobus shibatae]MCH4816805.1 PIN domain-containing protein [Saccharolobus shibatae]